MLTNVSLMLIDVTLTPNAVTPWAHTVALVTKDTVVMVTTAFKVRIVVK